MSIATIDVLAIGNAIVDVIATADDAFLAREGLTKGSMRLIDAEEATRLYARMGVGRETSGGSAANTAAGVAALGARAAFIGRVAQDQLGEVFTHDIRATGVTYATPPAADGPPTARCLILVTPDAQRTMNTFLGASQHLTIDDLDPELIRAARITYLEGYLWDPEQPRRAMRRAIDIAHGAGRRIAFTLSDAFCIERHRADFRALLDGQVDILFANEAEILSLFETQNFDPALNAVEGTCEIVVVTRSEKGAIVLANGERHAVPAAPVAHVVDTTGAGDLFAAGFLTGLTQGRALPDCARMGALAASEIISHYGARPEVDLRTLIRSQLG